MLYTAIEGHRVRLTHRKRAAQKNSKSCVELAIYPFESPPVNTYSSAETLRLFSGEEFGVY